MDADADADAGGPGLVNAKSSRDGRIDIGCGKWGNRRPYILARSIKYNS